MGEGERQGWLSTRNLRSFLQVESARQNATFIFGRERRETGENVGHVKFCCNSASEIEDMKHSRLVGLFVALLGVVALFSSLNKPGVAALRSSIFRAFSPANCASEAFGRHSMNQASRRSA